MSMGTLTSDPLVKVPINAFMLTAELACCWSLSRRWCYHHR